MTFSSKQHGLFILLAVLVLMGGAGYLVGRTQHQASAPADAATASKAQADRGTELSNKYLKEVVDHTTAAQASAERARAIAPRPLITPANAAPAPIPVLVSGGKDIAAPAIVGGSVNPAPVSAREFD